MTSNSRARLRRLEIGAWIVLAGCTSTGANSATVAPDSPRPARAVSTTQTVTVTTGVGAQDSHVELKAVRLRLVRGDTMLMRMAGAELLRGSADPIAVEVTTAAPLDSVARDASPEIYLAGRRISDTWRVATDRLIAFAANRETLTVGTSVTVAWLGDEERTRTRRPVTLTEELLRQIR